MSTSTAALVERLNQVATPRRTTSPRKQEQQQHSWTAAGSGGHSISNLRGAPSHEIIDGWSRTVSTARDCGQLQCALGRIDDTIDYEFHMDGFRLLAGSPFHCIEVDQWRARVRVNLDVHVPLLPGARPGTYPIGYETHGYLMATWFVPHVDDVKQFETPVQRKAADVEAMCRLFDGRVRAAREAGQLSCHLMIVRGGHDYRIYPDDAGVHQLDASLAVISAWAAKRGLRISVEVPPNHAASLHQGDDPIPHTFGHLIASWA